MSDFAIIRCSVRNSTWCLNDAAKQWCLKEIRVDAASRVVHEAQSRDCSSAIRATESAVRQVVSDCVMFGGAALVGKRQPTPGVCMLKNMFEPDGRGAIGA